MNYEYLDKVLRAEFGKTFGDYYDEINLGRSGTMTIDTCKLEVSSYAGNTPTLLKVVDVTYSESGANPKTQTIAPAKKSLSGGGNGCFTFNNYKPGLYQVKRALGTSGSIYDYNVIVFDDGIKTIKDEGFQRVLAIVFPEQYKSHKIIQLINAERSENKPVEIRGLNIEPVYSNERYEDRQYYELKNKVDKFLSTQPDEELVMQFIAENAFPIAWRCEYTTKETAEEVAAEIVRIREERKNAVKEAKQKEETLGLPKLKGTTAQINWAISIRDRLVKKNPNDTRLKTATTAKYWIEHHTEL
jgi:hypothetical protein